MRLSRLFLPLTGRKRRRRIHRKFLRIGRRTSHAEERAEKRPVISQPLCRIDISKEPIFIFTRCWSTRKLPDDAFDRRQQSRS